MNNNHFVAPVEGFTTWKVPDDLFEVSQEIQIVEISGSEFRKCLVIMW